MANPKRKTSKSRRDKRRHHWVNSLNASEVTNCANCGATKMSHRVCPECGYYKGKQFTAGNE